MWAKLSRNKQPFQHSENQRHTTNGGEFINENVKLGI